MTTTYVPNKRKRPAWLVDIDGTMTLGPHQRGPFEWDKVGNDLPNGPVMKLVRALHYDGYEIIFVSGRSDAARVRTENWLWRYYLRVEPLIFMRADGDFRKDAVVKAEIFDQHIRDHYWVQGVIDDRQQVVDMWREMGLVCLQAAPGDF